LIPENPAKRARPALRTPRKREGFTLEEARAILAAAEGEGQAPPFTFILYHALRLGEALGLRWSDVHLEVGRVTVRHNRLLVGSRMVEGTPNRQRSARTIAMLGGAIEALRRQRILQAEARLAAGEVWRGEDRVFSTRDGGGLIASNVDRTFRRIRVRNLPPHALRHATASILLGAGAPVAVAAKMMGHSVAMFCEIYADLLVEATHDAARQADAWLARQGDSPEERRVVQSRPVSASSKRRGRAGGGRDDRSSRCLQSCLQNAGAPAVVFGGGSTMSCRCWGSFVGPVGLEPTGR
jgi:integrase